ncbi:hypothetical protein PVT67_03810 [Gallaecimonas kandeliae]|uniref:hypothetical protein n=1 Tax=Gallaecimonas kandeliae TaxID=3029055 RepID=UPI0026493CA6|nr:hypothetical protein [Gallaecimonas kandeliae]WKE66387.1 hypothetical protein PVT67_03810 [Gallaecimonas kandeliae]
MNKQNVLKAVLLALGTCLAFAGQAGVVKTDANSVYRPTGKGWGELVPPSALHSQAGYAKGGKHSGGGGGSNNGIFYHGGPVMLGTNHVYYIWYGNWSNYSAAEGILPDLITGLSGSPIYNINTTYYDGNNQNVSNQVTLAGQVTDSGSLGAVLGDADIQTIVANAINNLGLPLDTSGVYFVLTAPDVKETSGFGTQYCGWHTRGTIKGKTIKYSFVGNPVTQAPSGCGVNSPSPNGDGGADAMASVIFHELSEAVTDPELNAWYDRRGYENADKCAWTFGSTYTTSNGATANVSLGNRDWLLQRNWVNANGGLCALSY